MDLSVHERQSMYKTYLDFSYERSIIHKKLDVLNETIKQKQLSMHLNHSDKEILKNALTQINMTVHDVPEEAYDKKIDVLKEINAKILKAVSNKKDTKPYIELNMLSNLCGIVQSTTNKIENI